MLTSLAVLAFTLFAWFTPFTASAPIVVVEMFERPDIQQATIIFGGDLMFDRAIRIAMEKEGDDHVLECIADTLRDADVVVANLEGPITPYPSVSVGSIIGSPENFTFTFTFATSTAELLKRYNISLVNIGNNHIMNFGRDGLMQTRKWLKSAGVEYFGDPGTNEADKVARPTIGGVPFSFVNWSDWTSDKTDHTVMQVRAEAEAGRIVVVYTHWGEEYVPPSSKVRQLAHSFVDAGAAIVIGSHPHVILEHEEYSGKHIYYSLGNMVFDQYFTEEVRNGLLVKAVFEATGVVSVEEIPVYLERDRRTCLKGG